MLAAVINPPKLGLCDPDPSNSEFAWRKGALVCIAMHCVQATFGSERTEDGEGYEYEQEAVSKRHSMTHEAVAAGRDARAYRTLLSHFSQRYPKIPTIDASFAASTCIAFDLMSVNLQGAQIAGVLASRALATQVSYRDWNLPFERRKCGTK